MAGLGYWVGGGVGAREKAAVVDDTAGLLRALGAGSLRQCEVLGSGSCRYICLLAQAIGVMLRLPLGTAPAGTRRLSTLALPTGTEFQRMMVGSLYPRSPAAMSSPASPSSASAVRAAPVMAWNRVQIKMLGICSTPLRPRRLAALCTVRMFSRAYSTCLPYLCRAVCYSPPDIPIRTKPKRTPVTVVDM